MTVPELLELSTHGFQNENLHTLHRAVLEECCENALNNKQGVTDKDSLVYAVGVAFMTCLSTLRATIKAGLEHADTVTLNYRNVTTVFDKESPLLKSNY